MIRNNDLNMKRTECEKKKFEISLSFLLRQDLFPTKIKIKNNNMIHSILSDF